MSADLTQLSLSDTISLAALIVALPAESSPYSSKCISESNFTQTQQLSFHLLNSLAKTGVVSVSHTNHSNTVNLNSDPKSFDSELYFNFKESQSTFSNALIRIENDIVKEAKNIDSLLQLALVDECFKFIEVQTNITLSSSFFPQSSVDLLRQMLSYRSLAEVFMLLWRAIKSSNPIEARYYQMRDGSSVGIKRAIEKAFMYHNEYLLNKSSVKPYWRKADYQVSSIMLLISEEVLGLGAEYYRYPSPLLNL